MNDFIPDSQMPNTPDFIPDSEADKYFGNNKKEQQRTNLLSGIPGVVLNNAGNVMKDIVQGIASGKTLNIANQQLDQAEQFEQQAMQTNDMAKRKALLQQAMNYRAGGKEIAQNTASNFSPDVAQNPLWRGLKAGTEVATLGQGIAAPKATFSAVASIPGALKSVPYLSKTGTYKAMEKTAAKATAEGASKVGDELAALMKQAVEKKYLDVPEVKKVLRQITSSMPGTPTKSVIVDISGKPYSMTVPSKINPTQLLEYRKQIAKTFGGANFFSPAGEKLATGVAQTARGPVTEALKELAPGMKNLDRAYSWMSKGVNTPVGKLTLGSPAENARRLAIYGIMDILGINPLSILKKGANMLPGE